MKITQITSYPIKSMGAINHAQAQVTPLGLTGDRLMMLVDDTGKFITQRKYPQMALLTCQGLDGGYIIKAPKRQALTVSPNDFSQPHKQVEIWGDICQAKVATKLINQWFSEFLGFSVSLVHYDQQQPRATDPKYSNPDDKVSFADGFPLLAVNQGSLDDLNFRLAKPVTSASFRPNLVISDFPPFAEDNWRQLQIGEVIFDSVKPCSRCVLTTVDPDTGIKRSDGEPLRTLSKYRKQELGVIFGANLIPRSGGSIKLGDKVKILA